MDLKMLLVEVRKLAMGRTVKERENLARDLAGAAVGDDVALLHSSAGFPMLALTDKSGGGSSRPVENADPRWTRDMDGKPVPQLSPGMVKYLERIAADPNADPLTRAIARGDIKPGSIKDRTSWEALNSELNKEATK